MVQEFRRMKTLMPYQRDAVNFQLVRKPQISNRPHSAILLPTGSGKTGVSCTGLKEIGAKSSLTFCPAPLKQYWSDNLVDWGGVDPESIFIVNSSYDVIPKNKPNVVVNYEYARFPAIKNQLLQRKFAWGQWDEAQRLKSLESLRTGHVLGNGGIAGSCVYKTFLSGTLAPNRAMELFPLLYTMAPETIRPYDNEEAFGTRFCGGYFDADKQQMQYRGADRIEELRKRIEPFVFVRTIDEVLPDLPPYIERNVYLNPIELEMSVRDTDLATLRKYTGVSKFCAIRDYLVDLLMYNKGEKVLCFCFTRDLIDLLKDFFTKFGVCVHVYGGISQREREAAKQKFLTDPKCCLFFLQYQAGGTGTDGLQDVCNRFVACEPEWSPGERWQAMGRLRRIGQKFPVICDNLVLEGSLDELIMWKCDKKAQILVELFQDNNRSNTVDTTNRDVLLDIAQSLRTIAELCKEISENSSSNGAGGKKETAAQKKAREKAEQEAAAAQAVAAMGLPAPTQLPLAPATLGTVALPAASQAMTVPDAAPPTAPTLPTLPPALPALPVAAPATPTITEEMLVHTVQAVMQGIAARLQKPQDAPEVKAYIVPAIQKHGGTELANVPQANWGALCDDLKAILA